MKRELIQHIATLLQICMSYEWWETKDGVVTHGELLWPDWMPAIPCSQNRNGDPQCYWFSTSWFPIIPQNIFTK